ncbi:MAG: MerR family transcriptional regulator [Myxococcota bacterium]
MSRFRIGEAVARSGVPASTIRTWERRYGALGASRGEAGGHRRYSEDQIERLKLLKRGVNEGDAIRSLARMSDDELRRRLAISTTPGREPQDGGAGPVRLGVAHDALAVALQREPLGLEVEIVSEDDLRVGRWDAVVVDGERVTMENLVALDGPVVFLTYHFASGQELLEWEDRGWVPVRAPVAAGRLQRLVRQELTERAHPHRPAPPRFTPALLQTLQTIQSSIECECPTNLAMILESVMAFERYCARCENQTADDALLHKRLGRETAEIRLRVEHMLERVILHDGLDLQALEHGER